MKKISELLRLDDFDENGCFQIVELDGEGNENGSISVLPGEILAIIAYLIMRAVDLLIWSFGKWQRGKPA